MPRKFHRCPQKRQPAGCAETGFFAAGGFCSGTVYRLAEQDIASIDVTGCKHTGNPKRQQGIGPSLTLRVTKKNAECRESVGRCQFQTTRSGSLGSSNMNQGSRCRAYDTNKKPRSKTGAFGSPPSSAGSIVLDRRCDLWLSRRVTIPLELCHQARYE